tara:strand:+ start:65 stop:349 length:285 start_codon:yes stop_codon:yes gene_type:complete
MKIYQYKIQWLFSVQGSFNETKVQQRKNLYSIIRGLGARSLTGITFYDNDMNIVDTYSNMVSFGYPQANVKTVDYIKKALKNDKIQSVELLKVN